MNDGIETELIKIVGTFSTKLNAVAGTLLGTLETSTTDGDDGIVMIDDAFTDVNKLAVIITGDDHVISTE